MEINTVNELVLKMKKHVKSLAYVSQDQDELLQDALLKVLRSRTLKSGFGSSWLYSVARSTVIDAHKHRVRELRHRYGYVDSCGRVCEGDDENVIYHPTYFDRFHDVAPEELDEIPGILASLSFEHQEVLLLYARGLTYQEIAHMVGLKVGTVRSRVYYARKHAHKLIVDKRKTENERNIPLEWKI
mgnify:CR=1 FL=1